MRFWFAFTWWLVRLTNLSYICYHLYVFFQKFLFKFCTVLNLFIHYFNFIFVLHLSSGVFLYVLSLSSLSGIWFVIVLSVIFLSHWLLKRLPFVYLVLEPWWISSDHVSISLLGLFILVFKAIICFCVTIMEFWFQYFCNVFWKEEVRNFDLCSHFVYLDSLVVPYIFWDLLFPFVWKWH